MKKTLAGALAALLALAACGAPAPNSSNNAASGGKAALLYEGPFAENEISIFQDYVPINIWANTDGWDTDAVAHARHKLHAQPYSGKRRFASQLVVRRSGDYFAFRLFFKGPTAVPDKPAYVEALIGGYETTKTMVGMFNPSDARITRTPDGNLYDTGWIWTPGTVASVLYRREKGPDGDRIADANWARLRKGMASGGVVTPAACDPAFQFQDGKSYEHYYATNVYGEDALLLLPRAEEVYRELFATELAEKERLEEYYAWWREVIVPVAPYEFMARHCGEVPGGGRPSSLPTAGTNRWRALVSEQLRALNTYASCVRRVRGNYDVAAYAAVFPQIAKKHAELQLSGSIRRFSDFDLSGGGVKRFDVVHPDDVQRAFDGLLAYATNPNGHARRLDRVHARRDDINRRHRAEEAREKREREARRQAALQAQLRYLEAQAEAARRQAAAAGTYRPAPTSDGGTTVTTPRSTASRPAQTGSASAGPAPSAPRSDAGTSGAGARTPPANTGTTPERRNMPERRALSSGYSTGGSSGACYARNIALDLAQTAARNAASRLCSLNENGARVAEETQWFKEMQCVQGGCGNAQVRCTVSLDFRCR